MDIKIKSKTQEKSTKTVKRENMETHHEIIKCTNCGSIETAEVEHTIPFYSYVHTCQCGYVITESDWHRVETKCAAIVAPKTKHTRSVACCVVL